MKLAASAVAAAIAAVMLSGSLGAAARGLEARQEPAQLVLTQQSTLVNAGDSFTGTVLPSGLPGTSTLRISVHDRVRSRSELGDANRGSGLRAVVRSATSVLDELPVEPDGSRRFTLPLSGGDQRTVLAAGVYPTEIAVLDASGRVLDDLVTDIVVRPSAVDAMPPLAVAVLADIHTTSPLRSGAAVQGLVDALMAVPEVTATLAVGPAWIDQLGRSTDAASAALLSSLRAVAAERPLLRVPYVATSPDALAAARIAEELPHQLDRGTAVVTERLGAAPSQAAWIAGSDLGTDGLRLLSALGIHRAVVAPDDVERVADGVLTPARTFVLAPPKEAGRRPAGPDTPMLALLTDSRLGEVLAASDEAALVAARSVAELAMLWFEQPGTPRSVIVPVDPSIDPRTVQELLRSLRSGGLFRPVALDDAFDSALALKDASGAPLRRSLSPTDGETISSDIGRGVRMLRAQRASVQEMVGAGSASLHEIDGHLLRATGTDLDTSGRRRELSAGRSVVAGIADVVSAPSSVTITLTAREGTVPLTIRNDSGGPVSVRLHFASSKLELPGGDDRLLTLTEPITRLDISVRTRTSGAFPFTVDITSPDGALELTSTTYSVRSTAVSGVGLLLSVGAGMFLIVWWTRHWRQSKRSEKLVDEPGATTS